MADIGALCNDVGFGLAQAWALDLREQLLRLNRDVTGHRLLRGGVVLGGARVRSLPSPAELAEIGERFEELVEPRHLERTRHGPLRRRGGARPCPRRGARGGGRRRPRLGPRLRRPHRPSPRRRRSKASRLRSRQAATCWPASGSGSTRSGRRWHFWPHYVEAARHPRRRGTRPGASSGCSHPSSGVGIAEGWRGAIVHRVELDDEGRLARVKVVDPSFLNWPALPVSLADTIVPDFPLANKSFNLSYAGNDL